MNKKMKEENKIFEELRTALQAEWRNEMGEEKEYTDTEVSVIKYINSGLREDVFIQSHIDLYMDDTKVYDFINENSIDFNDMEEEAIYNIVNRQLTVIITDSMEYLYQAYSRDYIGYLVDRHKSQSICTELNYVISDSTEMILDEIKKELKDLEGLEKELEDNRDYITEKVLEKFGEEIEAKATDIDATIKYFGDMVIRVILTNYTTSTLVTINNTKPTVTDFINATIDIIEPTP